MKETITLQLGSFGCHVGTHFWNINQELLSAQDDMDSGESFDAGIFCDLTQLKLAG